jgi:hypothetical protein
MLLVSADLVYRSPSRIDLVNLGLVDSPDQVAALEVESKKLSDLLKAARVKAASANMQWLMATRRCVGATKEGFNPPDKAEVQARIRDVTSSALHDHMFGVFSHHVTLTILKTATFCKSRGLS